MSIQSSSTFKSYPLINLIQKITIYETNHSFYIIGSNSGESVFKVIKVDRTCDPKSLIYNEDPREYDDYEIKELISMVDIDNHLSSKSTSASNVTNNGILRSYKAFALLGFVRFLEGYYMVLITKQIPIALLGYHVIYTIEDILMLYIPFADKISKESNLDEQK